MFFSRGEMIRQLLVLIVKLKCCDLFLLSRCRGRLESSQDEESGMAQMSSLSA